MPVLAVNKRATFDYEVLEKAEAGLVLVGHEVKSVKSGHISLKGSYITLKQNKKNRLPEAYLVKAHISKYQKAGKLDSYDPERPRKLLLHKKEIEYLIGKKNEQGLTLIPLQIYTKHSFVKLEFAVCRGKTKSDKREDIKKKDIEKRLRTLTKRQR